MLSRSKRILAFAAALLVTLAAAGTAAAAVAGKDYTPVSPPQATDDKSKVEVIEFFSYGCPHCHDFEPILEKWAKGLPKDVEVKRVPITFGRDVWVPLAKMYYTLEAMGELERMHAKVFNAMHNERVPFNNEQTQFQWMAANGLDGKKYQDTYKSFAVHSKTMRAQQIAAAYKVNGVPAVAVNGKYMTSASLTGSYEALTKVLDDLIQQERAGRK